MLTTISPSCAVVTKSGNLNFLEPSGPLQACNGTALCELIYSEQSILPPPKIFTVPPETLCISQSSRSTCLSLFLKVLKYKCVYSFICLIQLELKIALCEQFISIVNPLATMYRQEQLVLWNLIVVGTVSCVFFIASCCWLEEGVEGHMLLVLVC
jgi:hypothetical protein